MPIYQSYFTRILGAPPLVGGFFPVQASFMAFLLLDACVQYVHIHNAYIHDAN